MDKSKFDSLEAQLTDIKSLLNESEQGCLSGDFFEAPTRLEILVKSLCDELPKLSPKDAKKLGGQLPSLIKSLDNITIMIKKSVDRNNATNQELIKKAKKAYKTPTLYKSKV
jgi:hypothetical protein